MLYFEEAVFHSFESATVTSSQTKRACRWQMKLNLYCACSGSGSQGMWMSEGWLNEMDSYTGKNDVQSTTHLIPRGALDLQSHSQAYVQCPGKMVLWSNPSDVGSAIHEETTFFKLLWLQCVYLEFAFRNIHPIRKLPLVILRQGTICRG